MGTIAGIAAYIGFCLGVLKLFSMADSAASPEGKARARELLDFGWKDTVTRWPSVFVEMFDSIFGKRHFTWRCFWRSCVASWVAVIICTLLFWWLRPDYFRAGLTPLLDDLWVLPLFLAAVNLIPDYFSLLETRFMLRLVDRQRERLLMICAAVAGDFVLTGAVFALGGMTLGVSVAVNGSGNVADALLFPEAIPSGFLFDNPLGIPVLGLGIFLWTTYFTSIWLWLYALATFAGKLLLPILNRIQKFKRFVDLDNKPFLAMGWLSVMIITVLFAVGAVVKACV